MIEEIVTERCAAHGHPEFRLAFDPEQALRNDVLSLARHLEEAVAGGERFQPLETFQVGFTLDRVGGVNPGSLMLEEPDFVSMPIRWVPGVSATLRHLRRQKDVADSMGVAPAFSTIRHAALVCSRVPGDAPVIAVRFPTDGSDPSDSGWFVTCSDPAHDHEEPGEMRRESLYALACAVPSVVPYLALPAEWMVVFEGRVPRFSWRGEERTARPGSFVDQLVRALTP